MPEPLVPAKIFDLVPGANFQDYRLLERIGVGGQGVVWSAFDPQRKQVIAIKFSEIPDTEQGKIDDLLIERQAGVLVKLRHPHLLPVFTIGASGGLRYYVSPFVEGGPLDCRQTFPVAEKFRIISEVCAALDYLHSQNVIHRDVKPGNVLLDAQHHSYLSDFGLARILTSTTQVLHTGHATPPYASPEQLIYKQVTPRSDLYSLGVMLYELFTQQLPWKGEQELGMRQLYTQDEIPDPREIDPELPPGLFDILRQLTSQDPLKRPASAGEILDLLTKAFGLEPVKVDLQTSAFDGADHRKSNAVLLLKQKYSEWQESSEVAPISLTNFAIVDQYMQETAPRPFPGNLQLFMLQAALHHGYRAREWWNQTDKVRDRLDVALNLIDPANPAASRRALHLMVNDPQVVALGRGMPDAVSSRLLDLAANSTDFDLQKRAFQALRTLTASAGTWKENALPPGEDYRLAALAVPSTEQGDEAARLIGHLRSASAVATAFNQAESARRAGLLLDVQAVAGELPSSIPWRLRFKTSLQWILLMLSSQQLNTLAAYLLILLGCTLGFGIQAYLTYRLPTFMDVTRLMVSLERGVFMGIPLSFGILLTRLLVERLGKIRLVYRQALAAGIGWLLILTAFVMYHLFILQQFSFSPGILLGSLLIACGFATSALLSKPILRFLVSWVSVAAALAGSWWLYLGLGTAGFAWNPIIYYELSWSVARVLLTILLVSLPIAVLCNLVRLVPREY
jgi:serine/threonine protein kinase